MKNSRKSDAKDDSFSDTTTTTTTTTICGIPAAVTGIAGEYFPTDPPPLLPSPYAVGDIVMACHSHHYYEAKVERVEFHDRWRFFIHYRGWKKKWDEWVEVNRLMKPTEENLQKASLDRKQSAGHKDVSGKRLMSKPLFTCKKRKREQVMVKGKDSVQLEKIVSISIPSILKKQLMDDFESVKQMGKLVKLPRIPNVNDILEKYRDHRGKKDDMISASVGEVLSGLLVYFNKALPMILLYKKEHQQFQEAIVDTVSPSSVYGAEHLLRLFVKLPSLLCEVYIEDETLRELHQVLHDFLKFLQKNQSAFFLSTYHVPEASEGGTDKVWDQ